MPKKLEERIRELRELRTNVLPDTEQILRKALSDRSNLVVAESARTAAELRLISTVPDLLRVYERLFNDAVETDPKCWAKTAIVKALIQMEHSESAPFVRGFRHVQMEPVQGGRADSAGALRANCCLALVQCGDLARVDVLRHLVDAMADPEDTVRIEAVRAIHQLAGDEAVLLLRLKARFGDERPIIVGHVFDALLNLEQDRAVSFVEKYLTSSDLALRDEAALALGGSRLPAALKLLIEVWKETRSSEFANVLLRGISSSRLPEAIEFLLELIRTGTPKQYAASLDALKLHEHSIEIQSAIEEAERTRGPARI